MYVSIRIDEGAADILNRKCSELGLTKSQVVIRGCDALGKPDDADALLEQLDKQHDDPSVGFTQEEKDLLEGVGPTELPECCRHIYDDPVDPKPTCPHWEIAFVNYYGNKIRHYRNKLTGMSYFDYEKKYTEM